MDIWICCEVDSTASFHLVNYSFISSSHVPPFSITNSCSVLAIGIIVLWHRTSRNHKARTQGAYSKSRDAARNSLTQLDPPTHRPGYHVGPASSRTSTDRASSYRLYIHSACRPRRPTCIFRDPPQPHCQFRRVDHRRPERYYAEKESPSQPTCSDDKPASIWQRGEGGRYARLRGGGCWGRVDVAGPGEVGRGGRWGGSNWFRTWTGRFERPRSSQR